jgi:hypothetical protein
MTEADKNEKARAYRGLFYNASRMKSDFIFRSLITAKTAGATKSRSKSETWRTISGELLGDGTAPWQERNAGSQALS